MPKIKCRINHQIGENPEGDMNARGTISYRIDIVYTLIVFN